MDYLSLICNLAAVFAGFTAIVSALRADDETSADELALNKVRLRQMLEICMFTIATGLLPQLVVSFDVSFDDALRISGALSALIAGLLLFVQGRRVTRLSIRSLQGYSMTFTRSALSAGAVVVALFALAAAGVMAKAVYFTAVTLGLAIAGLQFFRTSTSMLRLPSAPRP